MAVRVDVDRVHMHEPNALAGGLVVVAPVLHQPDIMIVPGTPLENKLVGGCELLKYCFDHCCIHLATDDVATHIDCFAPKPKEKIPSIL